MRRSIKKRDTRSKSSIAILLFTLSIFFLISILLVSNLRIFKRRTELLQYTAEKRKEIDLLQEEVKKIGELESSNDFMVEKIAREQLLLQKPGEEVVFIVTPEEELIKVKEEKERSIWWNPFTWRW